MGAKKGHVVEIIKAEKPKVIYMPAPDEKILLDLLADIYAKSIIKE